MDIEETKPETHGSAVSERFEEFWDLYPLKDNKNAACQQWISVVTVEQEESVFACLGRYRESRQVNSGAIQSPARFIKEQYENRWGGDWPSRNKEPSAVKVMPKPTFPAMPPVPKYEPPQDWDPNATF